MSPKLSSSSASIGALVEVTMFSATAALMVAAKLYFDHQNHHPHRNGSHRKELHKRRVSFKVPGECSLLPGTTQPILGVLFAAAWCPDCTDVVPAIGKLLATIPNQSVIEIYYVSSDTNESELHHFVPKSIRVIPFGGHGAQQRADLKRHFQVCAQKEMHDLGIAVRKSGIPTLLLIETATGRILTEQGVEDVMHAKCAESVFRKWAGLLDDKTVVVAKEEEVTATPADATAPPPSSSSSA
jgi:hypothetical protein